ncbi:hypothetical protein AAHE18_19G215800 [Arachis hypogaea]
MNSFFILHIVLCSPGVSHLPTFCRPDNKKRLNYNIQILCLELESRLLHHYIFFTEHIYMV